MNCGKDAHPTSSLVSHECSSTHHFVVSLFLIHTYRNLLKDEWYLRLVRAEDGEEYEPNKFQEARAQAFKFVVLTSSPRPNEDMVPRLYAVRVVVKG